MHYSDDDIHSQGSLSKRYVWGRIRQVQSDSDQGSNILYLDMTKPINSNGALMSLHIELFTVSVTNVKVVVVFWT